MFVLDPTAYGPTVAGLLAEPRLADLGPGTPVTSVRATLLSLDSLPAACRAGLWLYFDFLDESHAISQDLETADGSFWHAIMHRREPDAFNSKYWWRKVASHPVLEKLREQAPVLGYQFADPYAFVDFVERVRDAGTADEELARRVQKLEWELLFDWCFHRALHG